MSEKFSPITVKKFDPKDLKLPKAKPSDPDIDIDIGRETELTHKRDHVRTLRLLLTNCEPYIVKSKSKSFRNDYNKLNELLAKGQPHNRSVRRLVARLAKHIDLVVRQNTGS